MHVHPVAVDDRRWRGATVLWMERAGGARAEHFDVHDFTSRGGVERERSQRHARDPRRPSSARCGRQRPRATTSPARDGCFPRDVARLAPLERHAAIGGVSLPAGSPELGPVLRRCTRPAARQHREQGTSSATDPRGLIIALVVPEACCVWRRCARRRPGASSRTSTTSAGPRLDRR